MSFMSVIGGKAVGFLSYLWGLLLFWLSLLFYIPFKNPHLLWVLIPIWIAWFFAEFFQEKKKTTFGNAISNGVIPVWVSIDWTRMIISQMTEGTLKFSSGVVIKFLICLFVLVYGLVIIIGGIKTKNFVHYLGRTREVTYILAVFTPLVYGVLDLSGKFFLAILIFFPVFYFVIEMIDRLTPDPEEMEKDKDSPSEEQFSLGHSDSNPPGLDPYSSSSSNQNPFGLPPSDSSLNAPDLTRFQR